MEYRNLSKEEFDAIVTGELAHQAIWFEGELTNVILDYFVGRNQKREEFERLIFKRDGIGFQGKIEILRGMSHLFHNRALLNRLEGVLKQVEVLARFRNAFAHGTDIGDEKKDELLLKVSLVSRSGKERVVQVSPESHAKYLSGLNLLFQELGEIREGLFAEAK